MNARALRRQAVGPGGVSNARENYQRSAGSSEVIREAPTSPSRPILRTSAPSGTPPARTATGAATRRSTASSRSRTLLLKPGATVPDAIHHAMRDEAVPRDDRRGRGPRRHRPRWAGTRRIGPRPIATSRPSTPTRGGRPRSRRSAPTTWGRATARGESDPSASLLLRHRPLEGKRPAAAIGPDGPLCHGRWGNSGSRRWGRSSA